MKKTIHLFLFLKNYIKGKFFILILSVLGVALISLITIPLPYLTGYILDNIFIKREDISIFYKIIALIASLHFFRYLIGLGTKRLFLKVNTSIASKMRIDIINKAMRLPMDFYNENDKGYIMSRISECSSVANFFSSATANIFVSIFEFVFSLVAIISLNIKISFLVIILIPFYFLVVYLSSQTFSKNIKNAMDNSALLSGEVFETLNNVEEIKILSIYQIQIEKIQAKLKNLIKSVIKQEFGMIKYFENLSLINSMAGLIVLAVSGLLILNNELTVGTYTAISGYTLKIFTNVQSIANIGVTLNPIFVSMERVNEFMNYEEENTGKDLKINYIDNIKIDNIDFKYSNKPLASIFQGISFQFAKGGKYLLKGANGSGKTTLIKLLLGLYSPSAGEIYYNGHDLSQIDRESLRNNIAVVSQYIFLFKGTVLENILYNSNYTPSDAKKAIVQYELEDHFNNFDNGLSTIVSHGGANMSGGQKQLISFVRAIISQKNVIILDEPTSNMDKDLKKTISNIILNQKLANILILISHDNIFDSMEKQIVLS